MDQQSPKSGTSRMSKALPAVPGISYRREDSSELHFSSYSDASLPLIPNLPTSPTTAKSLPPPPSAWPQRTDSSNQVSDTSNTAYTSANIVASPVSDSVGSITGSITSSISLVRKPVGAAAAANTPPLPPPKSSSTPAPSPQTIAPQTFAPQTIAPQTASPVPVPDQAPDDPVPEPQPKMSIPRRPVGRLQTSLPPLPPPEPSPAASWSSLLSAYYDDDDDESADSLTDETASRSGISGSEIESARTSVSASASATGSVGGMGAGTMSSKKGWAMAGNNGPAPNQSYQSSQRQPLSHSLVDRDLPTPPPKDAPFQQSPNSSSPSSQLWRRRSYRSNSNRDLPDLPDLRINSSHASSPSTASQETIKATQASTQPAPGARPVGLPGRNVRPGQSAKEPVPENRTMGTETSKVKQLKNKLHSSVHSKDVADTARSGLQQPPTPEYQKDDITDQIIDIYTSPVSPAASPDSPRGPQPNFSKDLPPEPPKKDDVPKAPPQADAAPGPKPIVRKDITGLKSFDQDLHGVKSLPDIRAKTTQSPPNVPVPGRRESPASDSASIRMREAKNAEMQAPRNSSARPENRRPMEQPRPPPSGPDPRIVQSETQGPCYRGRDGTLYPEMKVSRDPNPKATYFPTPYTQPLAPGTVLRAKPLNNSHFDCFQKHKFMNRRTNRNCPLTCQGCDKADAEDRWACAFCQLRICEQCLQRFNALNRDLRRLVNEQGANAMYGASPSAAGTSDLGLGLDVS